jgi:aerobic carbon-monoxide dehydrogenase medium subunit
MQVKAPAFDYVRPGSVAEAVALLAQHGDGAKLIAGGQSLVPALNLRLLAPDILIDIGALGELAGVAVTDGVLRIGAMTRHSELERSELVVRHAPLLARAIAHVAHPAIRNRGTLGGNVANADPASEMPACLVALEGTIVAEGPEGTRRIPAEDFVTGVYETALAPDEMIVAVEVPVARDDERTSFAELSRRSGDYALVGLAVRARVANGRLEGVRPVFFAVGGGPVLARAAAAALEGRTLDASAIEAAAAALSHDLDPEADLQITAATRLHLARVLLRRAVAELTGSGAAPRAEAA